MATTPLLNLAMLFHDEDAPRHNEGTKSLWIFNLSFLKWFLKTVVINVAHWLLMVHSVKTERHPWIFIYVLGLWKINLETFDNLFD